MKVYGLMVLVLFMPIAYGEIHVTMQKETFGYCERLNYTITVSEVTGEIAIIHIRDAANVSSSAIPIPISSLQTPVPAPFALEYPPFKNGTYHIDAQYSGEYDTVQFEIADLGIVCLPNDTKNIVLAWVQGGISDGFMADALQRYVKHVEIPFEITESNVYDVNLPGWTMTLGSLWALGEVSDAEFIDVVNYLAKKGLLVPNGVEAEI
ncbi:MAG: hypothetical protein EB828_06205 [Nitrosopumilus sp. D6]|nr:MAG: hypothetical protein EB828_06205 [Nitrosopumilus sp. D6]